MAITGWTSDNPANEGLAKSALDELHKAYPLHDWFVRIDGGVVIIKAFNIDPRGRYGMVQHMSKIGGDHTTWCKSLIRAAGEFLERANLRRGVRREGEFGLVLEGAPRWQRMPWVQ